MDLEKIDVKYKKASEQAERFNINRVEQLVKQTKQELKEIVRRLEDKNVERQRAEEDNEKDRAKDLRLEISQIQQDYLYTRNKLNKLNNAIKTNKEKVESHIQKLKEDPQLAAYIDKCIEKKFVRQLKKTKEEKQQVTILKELIKNHPTFEKNIIGMVNARDEIIKLEEELEGLTSPADDTRINEIQNVELPNLNRKFDKNKETIMNYVGRNDITLDEEYLVNFVKDGSKNFVHLKDGSGDLNIKKTLNNKIKSYNNLETNYIRGLTKLGLSIKNINIDKAEKQENKGRKGTTVLKDPTTDTSLIIEQPKWWQFIKRFKNWNARRKERKAVQTQYEDEIDDSEVDDNDYKTSLKYNVVKDYMKQREQELMKKSPKKGELLEEDIGEQDTGR